MLDYESPRRRVYIYTPEDRAWRLKRLGYYFGQVALFFLIVCTIGPNMFLFHSPFSPPPAYYATLTRPYVPMIAAIKAYQRDTGSLPGDTEGLPRQYLPAGYTGGIGNLCGSPSVTFVVDRGRSVLQYDFTPGTEGWTIYAPRYQGPIPAPLVPAAPSPVPPPATSGATNAPN